jgi:branched-subunit amino acid ABC-type transport system permease component
VSQLFNYAVPGIPFGCVFALMGVGLVLTYKAAGVFNLAFGAQAFVSGLAFVFLVQDGWPRWAAGIIAILGLGPLVGLVLDRLLFRRIRTASPLVKLVPSLGLLIALPQVALIIAGSTPQIPPPALFLDAQTVYFHLGSVPLSGLELSITVATVLVVAALVVLFRLTPVGLEMRAVVESPRLTELFGINAGRVSAFAWVLSSCIAALAGVLLAPLYSQLNPEDYTVLLVWGIAAAVIGRFASLPLALVGGLGLGVAQQILAGYLPAGIIATGLRPSLPFVVLLVFLPFSRQRQLDDPLADCDPPIAALAGEARGYRAAATLTGDRGDETVAVGLWHRTLHPDGGTSIGRRLLQRPTAVLGWVVGGLAVLSALTWVSPDWLLTMTQGIAFGIIFLSLTLLTGMSGQISLCQASFAGLGGFAAGQFANHLDLSLLAGMVLGGAMAAVLGVVVALPTLRLAGLPLALATLAFALLADNILFPNGWVGNGATGVLVPRPEIGPISFNASRSFFLLALVVLALVAGLVKLIGDGTMGRFLAAMRGSEVAAVSVGIDVHRLRVVVFAVSAGLAGVGGALYGSLQGSLAPNDFNYQISLVLLVVVAIVGLGSISGAVVAGVVYTALLKSLSTLPARYAGLLAVLFGLATLSYTRHPEGVVDYLGNRLVGLVGRLTGRWRDDLPPRTDAPAHPPTGVERVPMAADGVDR